jgi:hypothetical protein
MRVSALDEEGKMAFENRKEELNRVDDRNKRGVEGHDFAKDLHPERYPRESLSRLEEGILDDDDLRHADDRLGSSVPDLEERVDHTRNLSRLLVMLGVFLWIFAGVLLLWDGWDVRSGSMFFNTMTIIAGVVGLGLVIWGLIERNRVLPLIPADNTVFEDDVEQSRRRANYPQSDRAA